jgi:hypothetical protein
MGFYMQSRVMPGNLLTAPMPEFVCNIDFSFLCAFASLREAGFPI